MIASAVPLFLIVIFTSLPWISVFVIARLHGLLVVPPGQVCGFAGELCTNGTVTAPNPLAPKIELLTVTL